MIFTKGITKLFTTAALGALLVACGGAPTQDMSPEEIGANLGYSTVRMVDDVPDPSTFTMQAVNSRAAVMAGRFGVRYLLLFGRNCPEVGFGNTFETTATGGRLDTADSLIIDDQTYCPISEIYILE